MNKPISQIPWRTSPVFHNTPIGDRNVHVSVENGVLWDIEPVISGLCGTVLYTTTTQSVWYFITVQLSSITKFTLPREQSHPILSNLTTSYYVISHHIYHILLDHIKSQHITSHTITSHHIISYSITSHTILSYHVIIKSYPITSLSRHTVSQNIVSHPTHLILPHHIIWSHHTSHHITSYITSHHISHRIISHHITSHNYANICQW